MRVLAFLCIGLLALYGCYLTGYLLIPMPDFIRLSAHFGDVALLQIHEPVGNLAQCERIRCDEVLANTNSYYQGASRPGYYNFFGRVLVDDAETVSTL